MTALHCTMTPGRSLLGLSAYRRRYFADVPDIPAERKAPTHRVSTINDPKVRQLLREAQPDVTVVTCTTVLTPETIAAAGVPILNVHGGCLPDYRGWYGFFFALYEGAFDKIGSTIHFIDEGIDTGDIIEVVDQTFTPVMALNNFTAAPNDSLYIVLWICLRD